MEVGRRRLRNRVICLPGPDQGAAVLVEVRDTQVANRPAYVAIRVNLEGERDVLGLWIGPSGGEGAKQWAAMR